MIFYDRIIIGAGLYGLYSALFCGIKGMKVLVLECDDAPFKRATYINQARVHMGYHYPRSLNTAMKSAGYFKRFNEDFSFCIHDSFDQVYATSTEFSWTNAEEFMDFCKAANIRCDKVPVDRYFNSNMCDGAFLTEEYTYDAHILRDYFLDELSKFNNVDIKYGIELDDIILDGNKYIVKLKNSEEFETEFLLNATYASVNQILKKAEIDDLFKIKYELCEIILCKTSETLKNVGLTVMDGPFFSIMPFGKTNLHSLTSVTFTPHDSSFSEIPKFKCQSVQGSLCSDSQLGNCNDCPNKPASAWPYMSRLAKKYMCAEYGFEYVSSLYSMKPILKSSEVDDSRPTAIKVHSVKPTFISVLSGKINTVYDLDEYLI